MLTQRSKWLSISKTLYSFELVEFEKVYARFRTNKTYKILRGILKAEKKRGTS